MINYSITNDGAFNLGYISGIKDEIINCPFDPHTPQYEEWHIGYEVGNKDTLEEFDID